MYSKKAIKVRHTLAFRLTLWYAGIFSLSACIAFVFFYLLMTSMFRDQTDRDLYRASRHFLHDHGNGRCGGCQTIR